MKRLLTLFLCLASLSLMTSAQTFEKSEGKAHFFENATKTAKQFKKGTANTVGLRQSSVCATAPLTLEIQLDGNPEQVYWEIIDINGARIVTRDQFPSYANSPNTLVSFSIPTLADGDYGLVVIDAGGNGLCCGSGNGSYSLTDGTNVLVSGSNFMFSEVTEFCVGITNGGGIDTQAPTAPTNVTASNPTQTTIDLSWDASTDNVPAPYQWYGIFVDGVYAGDYAGVPLPSYTLTIPTLTPGTTYSFSIVARDLTGNFSGFSNTATETTLSNSTIIHEGYFETGWDGWVDGGVDCARPNNNITALRSFEGNRSIRLRDNSGVASSMTLSNLDLSSFADVNISFEYFINSFENVEDFWVRYNDGTGWVTVATFRRTVDFTSDGFYSASVNLSGINHNLSANGAFRIQCDASGNGDKVYIDQVIITGINGSSFVALSETTTEVETVQVGEEQEKTVSENQTINTRSFDMSSKSALNIFPNPTSQSFQIQALDWAETRAVRLINVKGETVQKYSVGTQTFDLQNVLPGTYIVRVEMKEKLPVNKLLVIK